MNVNHTPKAKTTKGVRLSKGVKEPKKKKKKRDLWDLGEHELDFLRKIPPGPPQSRLPEY
jgi:hypothetical protein